MNREKLFDTQFKKNIMALPLSALQVILPYLL